MISTGSWSLPQLRATGLGRTLRTLGVPGLVLVATAAEAQVVEYYHLDAVGSVRVVTNHAGAIVERHDLLSFGEECSAGPCAANPGVGAGQARKFTGKERDAESGLDYFGARYYGSGLGRFTTVDPVYTWRENLLDPQRWNRYAYARNNPLRYLDPDGRVISLVGEGPNHEFLMTAFTELFRRPGGRDLLQALADHPATITFEVGKVATDAQISAARFRKGPQNRMTFGLTHPYHFEEDQIAVVMDRDALREFGQQSQIDPNGVTTLAHEGYHLLDWFFGGPQDIVAGDRHEPGQLAPAERYGRARAGEKPDMSRDDAARAFTKLLGAQQP